MNKRIEILDSLRALAALSVCLYHFVCTTIGYITNESVLTVFENGKYGVQMFFVISGFVIPLSMYNGNYKFSKASVFLFKRLSRLEPPYLFSILLALGVLFLRSQLGMSIDHQTLSFKQICAHFMYLVPFFDDVKWLNQVYWTLAIEFQYYFLMIFAYLLLISDKLPLRLLAYSLFLGGGLTHSNELLPHWLPVFLVGIALFLRHVKRISELEFLCLMIPTFFVLFSIYPLPSVVFVLFTLLAIIFFTHRKIPLADSLGKASYSIYLVHPIIGASVINVLSHTFTANYQKPLVIVFGVLVTLIFSWLMYIFVERPSIKWSASFKYTNAK